MRLVRARIRDYRSICDSGDIEIEAGKTLLVGINEAGKTALLKALQQIKAPPGTEPFSALKDYPRSRYSEIQRGIREPSDVVVARAVFELDDQERVLVAQAEPDFADITEYVLERRLDNGLRYSFGKIAVQSTFGDVESHLIRLRNHLVKMGADEVTAELDPLMQGHRPTTILMGTLAMSFAQWLDKALPYIDEEDAREVARHQKIKSHVLRRQGVEAVHAILSPRVPLFVYYSTYFTVRPRIHLANLASREASGDTDDEYDFGNLCLLKLLGLSAKELSDLAAGEPQPGQYQPGNHQGYLDAVTKYQEKLDDRQYRLNAASVDLTQSIRNVWGDERVQLRIIPDGQYLKVVVVDDLGVEVELDQRSEGFRWLVSFFVVFKAQAQGDLSNAILLLDEPGVSLHALKQQEFRKTVTLLAENNQVIYTTHSPFMVGTDELDLVRIVEMASREEGTKVHTRLVVDDPKSVYPLQAALGYELAQSLFGSKRNLVCEGITDMMYLEAINTAVADAGGGLRAGTALVPASSASKVVYYSTLLNSQNLKVAALLDSDQAGERAAKQDELVQLLTTKHILRTKDYGAPAVTGPEIEDLFRETLVQVAKNDLGWDIMATAATQLSRRIVDIFTDEITGFSKYKLVRAFIRWLGGHDFTDLPPAEQESARKLMAAVNKALN